ncbi:unnamed protein product, partial [Gulo gulo]
RNFSVLGSDHGEGSVRPRDPVRVLLGGVGRAGQRNRHIHPEGISALESRSSEGHPFTLREATLSRTSASVTKYIHRAVLRNHQTWGLQISCLP